MKIGNKNDEMDISVLACIGCGLESNSTLTAFRNRHGRITGWLVACEECQPKVCDYEIVFQERKIE